MVKRFETGRLAVFHIRGSNEVAHNSHLDLKSFVPFYFLSENRTESRNICEKLDALIKFSVENNCTVSITKIFDILGNVGWEMTGQNPNVVEYSFEGNIFRVDYYFKREI